MIRAFIERFKFVLKGGENDMAMLYAINVLKGRRLFSKVPKLLQPAVKEQLELMDLDEKVLADLLAK